MELKVLDTLDRKAGMKAHGGSLVMSPGQPAFTEHNYDKIAKEGYMKNPFVYSALNFSGDVFADVEVKLKRQTNQGEEDVEEHEALELLAGPNEDQGSASFKKELYIFLKLAGKAYTHILSPDTGPNSGRPRQLINWVPSQYEPITGENELIAGFQNKNTKKRFDKEDVIYIKDFHPTNPADGHPAAMSAARVVDVSNAQLEWNKSILDNRGVPAHVFRGNWNQDQAKKWQRKNEREQSGQFKAGRDLYLPDHVEVTRLGFDTQELDWLNGMKEMKRIIYAIYQVPSELMNDGENKTYSNVENAIKSMIFHNTLPTWRLVLDAWNHQLLPKWEDGLFFEVDMDSIASLQESMIEKIEKGVKAFEGHLTNRGESRKMAGLDDDVSDADRTILRSNFIPMDSDVGDDVDEEELSLNGEGDE